MLIQTAILNGTVDTTLNNADFSIDLSFYQGLKTILKNQNIQSFLEAQ